MRFSRVFLLIMDGCGAGAAPDSSDYDGEPGNTLVNVSQAVGGLRIPHLRRLGLGNSLPLAGGEAVAQPLGGYGRLLETSKGGKDTVTGHWEMMGIVVDKPFPTYPEGFPAEVIEAFSAAIGRPILGNYASSGTVILDALGAEHMATGHPIVYTSADSVFQIAAHEEVVPIDELYRYCQEARRLVQVQRVIARPFEGQPGQFRRTERRKDFPLNPPPNVIDQLAAASVFVAGVGVIPELFDGRGFSFARRTQTNSEHQEALLELVKTQAEGFFFVNFEDFDMLYGHRNDPKGFADALETFDGYVGELLQALGESDLLLISADHGNDPTTPGTDHTREYAPLLVYHRGMQSRDFGIRASYADLGATVAAAFGLGGVGVGSPLL
jgi:phosphopentomutase